MGNVIGDLAEGASKGLFSGIGDMAKSIRVAITGIDPEKQAELEEKLLELEAAGDEAQNKVNAIEAANPSLFVSGWRPGAGWVCVLAMAYNYLFMPFSELIFSVCNIHLSTPLPVLGMSELMPVLLGMLGLGGMRSFEKYNDVARRK
jgi:hypothetical protein